jgi:hypothetical protein
MDWPTFVVSMTKALVPYFWGLVVAWVIFILRKPVTELLFRLRSARWSLKEGSGQVDFEKVEARLAIVQKTEATLERPSETPFTEEERDRLPDFEAIPAIGIGFYWQQIEYELATLARRRSEIANVSQTPIELAMDLQTKGVLDGDTLRTIAELASLRTAAVHGQLVKEPTMGELWQYRGWALELAEKLRGIPGNRKA